MRGQSSKPYSAKNRKSKKTRKRKRLLRKGIARRYLLRWGVLVFLFYGLNACQSDPNSPHGVAERFLDAHYVTMDLQAAKAYCIGLARKRVEEEIRLTEGQVIDVNTRRPRVYYTLLKETPRGEKRVSLQYVAKITVDGAGEFQKEFLLTLGEEEEGWRVMNYSEFDCCTTPHP